MTFQDVFRIKVKHLKTFDNLSSFLRAFVLIVMSKEVLFVPFEASLQILSSEIKMENSGFMGPGTFQVRQPILRHGVVLLRNFPVSKVANDGIIFENSYFPAIKQCLPVPMMLSTDAIFSGSVFSSSKTSIFAQKIDASTAMFEATFSSSD